MANNCKNGKAMATEKQSHKFAGLVVEHQALFEGWPSEDLQWAIQNPKEAIELFGQAVKDRSNGVVLKPLAQNPYLRLLYTEDRITLPVTGG